MSDLWRPGRDADPGPRGGATGSRGSVLASRACVILSSFALSGCRPAILDPQGPVGAAERTILLNSLAIMLAIVVPTIVAALAFAWHFRAGNTRANYRPDWAYSGRLEALVWGIPALVVIFLGGIAWIGSHDLDPAKPLASRDKPLEVQVVSLDWKWLFLYPDHGVASVNALVVPTGAPVHFSLTSASVLNAFFVPQLGGMIYTMSGMTTQLNLQADISDSYRGLSSHFSGDGFADMAFEVKATSSDDFNAWVKASQASSNALDRARYEELSRQSKNDPPVVFRLADQNLFDAIVMQHIPPAPGPDAGRGGPGVSPRPGG